jgi:ubiquinone/menaquinone biosynthesis C-methylase UbiE
MTEEPRRLNFGSVAEAYERVQVPAIFAIWAADLVAIAGLRDGERVIDLACGTGIVARTAALQVAPTGHVMGLDVNDAMLGVAGAQPQPPGAAIEWRLGNAAALPFADATFDVVLCQQGLQHIEDREAAVREMRRVLVPGGRAVVSMFSQRTDQEVWEAVTAPFLGGDAAARLGRGPWRRLSASELSALFRDAGFHSVELQTRSRVTRFESPESFVDYQLAGQHAKLYSALHPDQVSALRAAARTAFEPYLVGGRLGFPQQAHVILARQ